ncbi:MAG TPA: 2OG-Fe(II) oxygenase [Puia sp.]|nr:2OG-Fe(II) oxygenase [Puia sp.]
MTTTNDSQASGPLTVPSDRLPSYGRELHASYAAADPCPHICFDGLVQPDLLARVAAEFPDLGEKGDIRFSDPNQLKLASRGTSRFGPVTRELAGFLNSPPFLDFLERLTGISGLIADPQFAGGGLHEIRRGGFLKIHADFSRHPEWQLDRRINLLLYLNEDWEESYGGHFELWDRGMTQCVKKFLPVVNRMVIFNTTDTSYHGHPDPLACPESRSRRSLALYYYTKGRPAGEVRSGNRITTRFRAREQDGAAMRRYNKVKDLVTRLVPPAILKRIYRKMK